MVIVAINAIRLRSMILCGRERTDKDQIDQLKLFVHEDFFLFKYIICCDLDDLCARPHRPQQWMKIQEGSRAAQMTRAACVHNC